MKTLFLLLFSISLSTPSMANTADFEVLDVLFTSHKYSYTLEQWHNNKEELETTGFRIWKENKDNPEFCALLKTLPEDSYYTLKAWSELSPGTCSLNIPEPTIPIFRSTVQLELCGVPNLNSTLGPSRQVNLDTTGGPKLVTGDLEKCEVAFTFDDGPHPSLTENLLEDLARENVQANFFVVGRNVDRYPEVVNTTAEAGHIVGNHSYSHKHFRKESKKSGINEIIEGFKSLLSIWDFVPPFFRFPYGAFTKQTRKYIQQHDVAEFFWNMDTRDWAIKDPNKLVERVFSELNREKRGILLFHDVHPQTIEVIPQVLIALKQAGYTTAVFVPEELIEGDFPN